MYRYSVDNAVTYTPDDFVLFRESPFAAWMERLTLENPDHGIPPDLDSSQPGDTTERQDDIVETLRAEGRAVALIDWEMSEPERRAATLDAMRSGADFVVNGQLALGPLSGTVNLLMRTSGYSELGDYLYVPCDTQVKTTLHSAFRLCFLADLLHSLQGQLPPQMLIIRGGSDVVPLQTEDHIYYYRAVKQRFMRAMVEFRKHRMPDPAESSHFGRWSDCASEVLKQRAERPEQGLEDAGDELEAPQLQVVSSAGAAQPTYLDDEARHVEPLVEVTTRPTTGETASLGAGATGQTLAEQASMLTPGSFNVGNRPGHTPNLARFGGPRSVSSEDGESEVEHRRRSSDVALENLEFIGSSGVPTFVAEPPVISAVAASEEEEADELAQEVTLALDDTESSPLGGECLEPESPWPDTEPQIRPEVALQAAEPLEETPPVEETIIEEIIMGEVAQFDEPELSEEMSVESFDPVPPAPALAPLPDIEPREPFLLPPQEPAMAEALPPESSLPPEPSLPAEPALPAGPPLTTETASPTAKPHPLDSDGFTRVDSTVIDMDSAPPPCLAPVVERAEAALKSRDQLRAADEGEEKSGKESNVEDISSPSRTFSNSLITSEDFDDR